MYDDTQSKKVSGLPETERIPALPESERALKLPKTDRIIRRPEVKRMVGLCDSTIYLRMSQGTFPKSVPLGGRLVGWLESDIQKWIDDCASNANAAV